MNMKEEISSIIEGAFPDTPTRAMYASMGSDIPKNIRALVVDDMTRMVLYGTSEDFELIELVKDPEKILGGYPIRSIEPNFRWIFDAQRSIVTKDGRIYVDTGYFKENWTWYLDAMPIIVKDCGNIFKGLTTDVYLNKRAKNIFSW